MTDHVETMGFSRLDSRLHKQALARLAARQTGASLVESEAELIRGAHNEATAEIKPSVETGFGRMAQFGQRRLMAGPTTSR